VVVSPSSATLCFTNLESQIYLGGCASIIIMKRPSFAIKWCGTVSVILGSLSIVLCYITFIYVVQVLLFYIGPAVSLVGIGFGIFGFKTRRGVIGVVLSSLPILFLISMFLGAVNLTVLTM
jgi:hypothetical protein